MFKFRSYFITLATLVFVYSCGGGGGGGGAVQVITASISSFVTSISSAEVGSSITLNWSSSNASSCTASGDWSGTKSTSGSEDINITKAGTNTFSLTCTGDGGSSGASNVIVNGYRNISGVTVDGYMSGANIFIDKNENFTQDSDESNTSSDNSGSFTIKFENGSLISLGGQDADTQTQLDKLLMSRVLNGHSNDVFVISPITTIAALLTDNTSSLNTILGIDASINFLTVDPVANKGDGGINDFLYEKGNQLTVLALGLQNISNEINTTNETTQDYFKSIAEELDKEFNQTSLKVNIESEAFVSKVIENINQSKNLNLETENKTQTLAAFKNVLPIISVKSKDSTTTAITRFSLATFQNDLIKLANGSAIADEVAIYTDTSDNNKSLLSYIANDQNIDISDLFSSPVAFSDSSVIDEDTSAIINVLSNDSFDTSNDINLKIKSDPSNGTATINNNKVTYNPNKDFFGTDSFTYEISYIGGIASVASVSVTINPINDTPSIDIASTISINEDLKEITSVSTSDVDNDDLTLTLSGNDQSLIQLSSTNILSFKNTPDCEGTYKDSYNITLTLNDGTETVTKDVLINLICINDQPLISNLPSSLKLDENIFAVKQITATDAEGDDIYYSLNGTDADLLSISSTGLISFKSAPDYEIPQDQDEDNIYEFSVIASNNAQSYSNDVKLSSRNNSIQTNSSQNVVSLSVQNVDEDLIDLKFKTTDGTSNQVPTLTVEMMIDELTNATEVQVLIWKLNDNQTWYTASKIDKLNWKVSEELASNFRSGTYEIRKIRIQRGSELAELSIVDTALIEKGFTIRSDIFNSRSDDIPPILQGIDSISVSGNDGNTTTPIKITIVASIDDGDGVVEEVFSYIKGPGGETDGEYATLNSSKSKATFEFTLDSRAASGTYQIDDIRITDSAGNEKIYLDSDLNSQGFNYTWDITNTIADNVAPNITDLSITSNINTSDLNRKQILISLSTDNQSAPIRDIYIRLISPDNVNIDHYIVSNTSSTNGSEVITGNTYTYTIDLPLEYPEGIYNVSYININDQALNNRRYSQTDLINLGFDTSTRFGGTVFSGKAIDGYISGADIFIDQNFNFKYDSGEYTSKTKADGSFEIVVFDSSLVACLENRPIIADVPAGAIDSSLGTVETAYQMVLPSIKDSGSSSIVISPFTSLFSEAILSAKSTLKQDLTVAEGCSSTGDTIASNISSRVNDLKTTLTNTFAINTETMTGDFIVAGDNKINETSAQNIAKLLPYLRIIDNQVSDALTTKFSKEIRANVSLSESALNIVFGGSSYEKLPLDFKSIYRTDANSAGWYQEEVLKASGAFISKDGVLSRADCSATDTQLCNITDLTLKNIANASTSFTQNSNFFKSNIDFDAIGINAGSLAVTASDSRAWRNNSANWQVKNNRDRECQWDNAIQFQNTVVAGTQSEFRYSSYSQGYEKADCESVRHYYYPILSVTTTPDQSVNDNSLQLRYYIPDITRSGISDNLPYDFITNRVTIDPLEMVKDIANLPRTFKELDSIRRMFNGEDYVFFEYNKDSNLNAYFEAGTNPRNDMYWDRTEGSHDRIYGQAARNAFYSRIIQETTFTSDITGTSAPINSSILGRIANSFIEIVDYVGADEIKIPVYPTYNSTTKNLDFSMTGASIDLENLHDFIENGINSKPVSVNLWYSPDDSISKTVPVKLYLYEGNDTNIDSGEGFFTITFDLIVSSQEGSEENPVRRTASQTWSVSANQSIIVKYTEGNTELSKTITNSDLDQITLSDNDSSDLSGYKIDKPSTLNAKILQLLSNIDEYTGGIKNFFVDGGTYTIKLDLGSGGHSLISYYRNTVDTITGTFTTKSTPTYPISVNDMRINEGTTENLCFYRPTVNSDATSFNLSFTQRERPGKGGLADDFSLSSSNVSFAAGETQKCVEITAATDTHFDWVHDVYLDISSPSSGQALSRNRVKISILDSYGYQNRISWKAK